MCVAWNLRDLTAVVAMVGVATAAGWAQPAARPNEGDGPQGRRARERDGIRRSIMGAAVRLLQEIGLRNPDRTEPLGDQKVGLKGSKPKSQGDPAAADRALVSALGHENWQRREAAHEALRRRGAKALEAVAEGFRSPDAEIAARCGRLLGRIGRPALQFLLPLSAPDVDPALRDRARALVAQIRGRSWMGVNIRDVEGGQLGELGLRNGRGALVTRVLENTPAKAAGVRDNDFIVDFDGVEIEDVGSLILAVGSTTPNRPCQVRVIRAGRKLQLPITLKAMPPLNQINKGRR